MRAFIGIFFFGLVALVAGSMGFQAGVASAVAGGTGNPAVWLLLGGPHIGGLFLLAFLFFPFAIAMAVGGARRRHQMHGMHGMHGPWGMRFTADGDPRGSWMREMHRQMHEADATRAGGANPTGTTEA